MNYLIDFHGVIDTYPDKFRNLLISLWNNPNDAIYICTGGKKNDVIDKLDRLKLYKRLDSGRIENLYKDIISISDTLEKRLPPEEIEYDFNGNVWVDDSIWWKMKGEICEKYKIDIMIDDSEEYFSHVPKNVLKFHVKAFKDF